MTPEELAVVSRISPELAAIITLSIPVLGGLAYALRWLPRLPVVRQAVIRWTGWDPLAVPEDDTTKRAMLLMDQMQEELARCRTLLDRYGGDLDQMREARLLLMAHLIELRDAAIAARTQVHALERRFGMEETVFAPLPAEAPMAV